MKIGAQLYTIRDYCKTPEELAESMKKIADMGYTTIQLSGVCAYDPEWMKGELDKCGLKCVLTHIAPARLREDAAKVAAEHDIFGCENVGLGMYPFDGEKEHSITEFARIYKPIARTIKENGKYFMYHNHDREFRKEDGRLVIERLSELFAPDEMGFTLDAYWVQKGGADPAYWIERLSGRVPCIHLKDMAYEGKMAVIGEGNINHERIFEKAESAGTEYMIVEQDDCYGENPFDCLERSLKYLHSMGFR